jgi:hypothetical protein
LGQGRLVPMLAAVVQMEDHSPALSTTISKPLE